VLVVSLRMALTYFENAQESNDRPAIVRIAPFVFFSPKPLLPSHPLPKIVMPK
jgi:hypothetical protein